MSQRHLLERPSFPSEWLSLLSKTSWPEMAGVISGLSTVSLICMLIPILVPVLITVLYQKLGNQKVCILQLCSLSRLLWLL